MKNKSFSQTIVEPYAEALMSLAKEHNLVDTFGNNVQSILTTLKGSDDLNRLLSAPLVPETVKKDLLISLFNQEVHPYVASFLGILVDRRRILFLEAICLKFQSLLREMNQIALAEISSAVALTETQQETLKEKVKSLTGAVSVELSIKINPDLIGGVIIRVGSQVIDASIRGQLRRLTSGLMANV